MKTYLVTGGAGFIGAHYVRYILNKYEEIKVINVDALTYAGNLENLTGLEKHKNYTFKQLDICDEKGITEIFEKYDVDYVVNFAAESHVDRSITNPEIFAQTNIMGTVNMLNIAKKYWYDSKADNYKIGKKFLQVSTDEVYGSLGKEGYFTEQTPLDPHSPYSSSKAAADLIVKAYFDTYKFPINITRCSNNYGAYQFPEKLIPLVINNCLNKKTIPLYGDGLNVRDWLYVEDHCKAIDIVLNNASLGEVYNIGGHNEKTNREIIELIIDYLGEHVDEEINYDLITYVEDRKGHDRRYGIDPTKIKNDLGWLPETKFEDGIVKTIKWYLSNDEWMENVLSGEYKKYYQKMYKE